MKILNKHNMKVVEAAAREQGRYAINGVYIKPEETVATNGKIMVVISAEEVHEDKLEKTPEGFEPFIMTAATARKVAALMPSKNSHGLCKKRRNYVFISKDQRANVVDYDGNESVLKGRVEGIFPQYTTVFPQDKDFTVSKLFSASLLSLIFKMVADFTKDELGECSTVKLEFTEKNILKITAKRTSGQTFKAIILGMSKE